MKTIKQMEAIIEQNKKRKQDDNYSSQAQDMSEDKAPAPSSNIQRPQLPPPKPFPSFTGYDPNAKNSANFGMYLLLASS